MLWAKVGNEKRQAFPGLLGLCPFGHALKPKCGAITAWHWAHEAYAECDSWSEGETEWHLEWKKKFPKEWSECAVTGISEKHIADILIPNGPVIEFQHSPISADEIWKRNSFYGKRLIWVFDMREVVDASRIFFREKPYGFSFYWMHPKKSTWEASEGGVEVFWDLGDGSLFKVKKIYKKVPCGGYGEFVACSSFVKRFTATYKGASVL